MDSIQRGLLELQARAKALHEEAQAKVKAQEKQGRIALDAIEKGLYNKLTDAAKNGDKKTMNDILLKVKKHEEDKIKVK